MAFNPQVGVALRWAPRHLHGLLSVYFAAVIFSKRMPRPEGFGPPTLVSEASPRLSIGSERADVDSFPHLPISKKPYR